MESEDQSEITVFIYFAQYFLEASSSEITNNFLEKHP